MVLLHPIYLILLLPLGAALWMWGFRSRLLLVLRALALVLIVAALAGVSLFLPRQAGTVVVIADRSHSLPADAETAQREAIDLLQDGKTTDDQLAVVAFGRGTATERVPLQGKFPGFQADVGRDASNLTEAMEMGLALIPRGAPGRLLVLSDGQWTGRDPVQAGVRAAERGVAIDHRALQRSTAADVAIARLDAPSSVNAGESFLVTAWIHATAPQEVAYELRRDGERLAAGRRQLDAGLNRLTFRDQAAEPGTQAYALSISARENDAILENNTARLLVGVAGSRPLLVVTSSPDSSFADLLAKGGVNIKAARPENCVWTLEELSRYAGVVLENVPADRIGHNGMESLAAWVQQTGAGLMLTGGRASYGPGGYFKSPLDPILPVSMELRQEHRKLSLAIVVTLDRSGSMAMPVGGGRVKMDLANLGAAQVLDLMSPTDEFGCIAVDSAPHVITELGRVTAKAATRDRILRINSQGGGIFVYEALEASYAMLQGAKAGTRHIILFADAADAEEPKQYEALLAKCRSENITVSVIGLGQETHKDGELLKDVARRGGGRVFFTENPEELPRLFAQDTFVVARSAFLDEPTPFKTVAGLTTLTSKDYTPPALGGYNLCYLRREATLGAVTLDEYKAPVVAAWQSGAGRVVCYTGEADGKYTGAMAGWQDVGDFFSSLARWTLGKTDTLLDGTVVTQERHKGLTAVKVHLDPDRKEDPFTTLPEAAVLRAVAGKKPALEKRALRWIGPDTLAIELPLYGTETMLATVNLPGHGPVSMPPVCLPYSPEYEPPPVRSTARDGKTDQAERTDEHWGPAALEHLSRLTGGRERVELPSIWREMPRHARLVPLAPWLIVAAIVLVLLEVLERLTGILGSIPIILRRGRSSAPVTSTAAAAIEEPVVTKPVRVPVAVPATPSTATATAPPPKPAPPPAPKEKKAAGILEALDQAQKRSRKR